METTHHQHNRVLIEVDVQALERLLARKAISVDELRCVDRQSKRCLQQVFLELLNRQLIAHG